MLIVDPWHWLDKNGELPVDNARIRRQVLRIARLIEYGGPLQPLHTRETLVECSKRPGGKPCPGLLWVSKNAMDAIEATCAVCDNPEIVIHNWHETQWAEGMMEPLPLDPTPTPGATELPRVN
jgi:hypothetical protein